MNEIKIGKKFISSSTLFFIVEEGQANLGNFKVAKEMIEYASHTDADAIEFQFAIADDFYIKNHEGNKIYKKREFSESQYDELIHLTKKKNLEMIVSPLSHNLVPLLAGLGCSAFNINASDLTNPKMLSCVVNSFLPFFLSTPLATEKEIDFAINYVKRMGADNFILMHGQHTMASGSGGTNVEHTSLGYINTLKKKYKIPVGFIDHTPYTWTPSCAVASGADVISKHLLHPKYPLGPDYQVCLKPQEMK